MVAALTQVVRGPLAVPPTDGLRGARGAGVIENPADDIDRLGNWQRGYRFVFDRCNAGGTYDPTCTPDPARKTADRGFGGLRSIHPFLVIIGRTCGAWGWEAQDFQADAQRLLDAYQYGLIAREMWGGAQAIASGWTNPDATDNGGPGNTFLAWSDDPQFVDLVDANGGNPESDTFDPVTGLAELEAGLASCSLGGGGVIHATKRMASIWTHENMLVSEGNRLFTVLGTQVIADNGYDGSGPTGPAPDEDSPIVPGVPATAHREWAYATGPISLRIQSGPPFTPGQLDSLVENMDRAVNDITYYVERLASPSWGCCHLAAAIDPGLPSWAGGGGESS